jgi:DNA-binding GntR family transcriptional regulator
MNGQVGLRAVATADPGVERANVAGVRARLREALLRSELPPDTVHSQDEVRTFLDVGRTPFREALRMVQAEGLIEVLTNGRLRIPGLSMDDFIQIQIARIALESAAVRLSVPGLGPDDFAHLEGYMAQMSHYVSSDHFDRVELPHLQFHRGLVAGAGAELLVRINDLTDRSGRYRWAFSSVVRSHWETRTAEHRAILDAAKAGDPEDVAARLALHYLESGHRLADALGGNDQLSSGERFRDRILHSLAPSLRDAVLKLD